MLCNYYKGKLNIPDVLEMSFGDVQYLWFNAMEEAKQQKEEDQKRKAKEQREEQLKEMRQKGSRQYTKEEIESKIKHYTASPSINRNYFTQNR